ncbi:hypothetical protein [Actinophytocola sp.]|uniref:hypothetical protein n=1 Tax=Actinophytocola sp. TaxID=1872138 RepID=UPI003D6AD638
MIFGVAGGLTVVCGIRLVGSGTRWQTGRGWGEAFLGAAFFGLVTSLSGMVMTGASTATAQPELAYGNAVGGIAVRTLAGGSTFAGQAAWRTRLRSRSSWRGRTAVA